MHKIFVTFLIAASCASICCDILKTSLFLPAKRCDGDRKPDHRQWHDFTCLNQASEGAYGALISGRINMMDASLAGSASSIAGGRLFRAAAEPQDPCP